MNAMERAIRIADIRAGQQLAESRRKHAWTWAAIILLFVGLWWAKTIYCDTHICIDNNAESSPYE